MVMVFHTGVLCEVTVALLQKNLEHLTCCNWKVKSKRKIRNLGFRYHAEQMPSLSKTKKWDNDIATIASLLQRCGHSKALLEGKKIHDHIVECGLDSDAYLGNNLILMYSKCGALKDSRHVFDNMNKRNTFSWNIMINGYAQQGQVEEAFNLFNLMPERNVVSWNSMISLYAKQQRLKEALYLFQQMPERDSVSWNTILMAYVESGQIEKAFQLFQDMPHKNVISCNVMISAYAQQGYLHHALQIFEEMPRRDVVSWNSMITAYVQYGTVTEASNLFNRMPESIRDGTTWTIMISAYGQQGQVKEALQLFHQTSGRNLASWNAMISTYFQNGQVEEAFKLFDEMPQRNVVSWNAMISGFAEHGYLLEAFSLFQQMPERNEVSWNIIIKAYAEQNKLNEAVQIFEKMQRENFVPNSVTFVTLLDVCGNTAALSSGIWVHKCIVNCKFKGDVHLRTALINMYAKCGCLDNAHLVFNKILCQNVATWTTMISSCAQHGLGEKALQMFKDMHLKGIMPDKITFVTLLSACSYVSLIDEGFNYYLTMNETYNFASIPEHYTCLIDLLGHVGWLDEAEIMVLHIPLQPNVTVWTALLGSCGVHANIIQGKHAAQHVFDLMMTGNNKRQL